MCEGSWYHGPEHLCCKTPKSTSSRAGCGHHHTTTTKTPPDHFKNTTTKTARAKPQSCKTPKSTSSSHHCTTTTKTPPDHFKNTTTKTARAKPQSCKTPKSTSSRAGCWHHCTTTTKTGPQHHHKNTTTPPQQKHHHTTTKTPQCVNSMCEHDVWALYMLALYSMCEQHVWARCLGTLYVSTLCEHEHRKARKLARKMNISSWAGCARTPKSTRITTQTRLQFLGRMLQRQKRQKSTSFIVKPPLKSIVEHRKSTRITTKNEHGRSWSAEKVR